MFWEEITPQYAGLFFRVWGGNSAPYNTIQEQDDHRLTGVQTVHTYPGNPIGITIPINRTSGGVVTGKIEFGQETTFGLVFAVSGSEVRPRNSAIRIWRRV